MMDPNAEDHRKQDRNCAPATITFRIGFDKATSCGEPTLRPCRRSDWRRQTPPMLSRRAPSPATTSRSIRPAGPSKSDNFDFDGFGKRINPALPADMAVIGETLPSEYLDFAWETCGGTRSPDGKRPDPTGGWSTPVSEADKRAAMERLKARQRNWRPAPVAIQASLLDGIRRARRIRRRTGEAAQDGKQTSDGSKMNKHEKTHGRLWR